MSTILLKAEKKKKKLTLVTVGKIRASSIFDPIETNKQTIPNNSSEKKKY